MLLVALLGCPTTSGTWTYPSRPPSPGDHTDDTDGDTGDTGDTGTADDTARWLFLVYMDGDNNLEAYVTHDLNELEMTGSGDGVEVIVQADRIDGYSRADGDWTGARRYRIVQDEDENVVSSEVVEELGEVDMGDPATLADFLAWATAKYPAKERVLILWDHGDGWLARAPEDDDDPLGELPDDADAASTAPPPSIASDDTSGSALSIARGDLAAGLAADVAANGRFAVLGFDACNMASWEVAHAMGEYAETMSAAETTVGYEGFQYAPVLDLLRSDVEATPADLAVYLSQTAVEQGGELTHSAIDLDALRDVSAQIDALAATALADDVASDALLTARDSARGADEVWAEWYLDLGDLADQVTTGGDPALAPIAGDLRARLDDAVLGNFHGDEYAWATGLTLYFDPDLHYLQDYSEGEGATWSRDTRWDDYLKSVVRQAAD